MKNYSLLIFCSLLLCSFQYNGDIESCRFPKSAKQLGLKKIQITGWINRFRSGQKSMLVKTPFDLGNMEKSPSLDENIELDGSFDGWSGQKVRMTGILRLNPKNVYRHFYILENIEQIEWTK